MACWGTPRLNSHHPHPVLVPLGDSESTTHGPWRRPSHCVLLCRARTPESQPHSHTPTSVCAVRHLPRPGMLSRRAGQALCRRSIPCSRIALLLFRLRPAEADNAWLSVSQYLIQSQSPPSTTGDGPRPMATATHLVQNCGFLSGISWVRFSCPCWDCCSSKFDLPVPKLNSSARGAKY